MSKNGASILRALLFALIDALGGKSRGSAGRPTQAPEKGQRGTVAQWKSPATKGSGKTAQTVETVGSSAGQTGSGATRDLSRAEILSLKPRYEPHLDGEPDPGEVVWTWVPFVENDGRGKDRPVLIIARIGSDAWAGCYLSTKQHRGFVSIGSGAWDAQGRESFLSPERVLRVSDEGMRRESIGLSRERFERAVEAVMRHHRA